MPSQPKSRQEAKSTFNGVDVDMVCDEYSWTHHEDSTDDGEGSEVTRKDLSADREADPTAAGSGEDCERTDIVKAS
ncbi:hypothetical protein F441_07187 [Phytophthora nicotianae CJ01A1]|uniref:Uncharacterized protein n=4 Tax=Phytophthora nicotianae TaxID=4792 RepID=V9FEJ8_PHYNI|nr:hypothetical protein F443_07171 [Phytophthora nicotianae P1569]ETK88724.1 hypothetical protein L915_07059 [Phytophthora nicotianae]ETL95278.1 hypothetical protein L917_06896 [Phytophthora nicotianae]ETP18607.1 hypothetical protein F441_07187 [Phytophthora nicotianae CJ01A1]